MELCEKQLNREIIYEGKIFTVTRDEVELADKSHGVRELILHHGGAGVLPVDSDGNIMLVKQYRAGVSRVLTEICAGKLEAGENPLGCAKRELAEELGLTAKNIIPIGEFIPTPAYLSEITYLYIATDLGYVGQSLDEDEFLEIVKMSLEKAVELVMDGTITDGKTVIAVLKAERLVNGKA